MNLSIGLRTIDKRQRLVGIDLLRDLAIYGVVILQPIKAYESYLNHPTIRSFCRPFFKQLRSI